MDRHFLMRSDKFNKWFCGRCGKRLIPDLYNAGKHAQSCGFSCSESGRDRNVIADYDRGYRLTAEGEDLHLEIRSWSRFRASRTGSAAYDGSR